MKSNRRRGNSMVEYVIGIGCLLTVCMIVLGGLGFGVQDLVNQTLLNINDPGDQSVDLSNGSMGGIWTNGVSGTKAPPWQLK
jgi:hypothetical protein